MRENAQRKVEVTIPGETLSNVLYSLTMANSILESREFPTWEETHTYNADPDTYLVTLTTRGLPTVFGGVLLGVHNKRTGFTPVDGLSPQDVPELPESVVCRECGTRRAKNHYVVLDTDGTVTYLADGGCLQKWIGRNPSDGLIDHAILERATHIIELLNTSVKHVTEAQHYDTNLIVAAALWATDEHGYHPRNDFRPTKDVMESELGDPSKFTNLLLAAAVLRQCALDDLTDETPILKNMKETIKRDKVTRYTFGLIAYLPTMYANHERVLQARANGQPAPGEDYAEGFVGTIKERVSLSNVTVETVRPLATGSTLVTMRTADNHRLTWFATFATTVPTEGHTGTVTCTIRKHDTYKGTSSTIVNRCIFP